MANNAVSFDINAGEIHALLGENGAGKSTLMNIASGMLTPDSGTIRVGGEKVVFRSPADAIKARIGMVHQHFELVRTLTVAENITLHAEIGSAVRIDRERSIRTVRELSARTGLDVPAGERVSDLSVAVQQRVEILKALYRKADVLLLDEPTAVLSPPEVIELLEVLRDLASQGTGIAVITHKLEEATTLADRLTVMRAGTVVDSFVRGETTPDGLARSMVGREVISVQADHQEPGALVLSIRDLTVVDSRGIEALRGIDLDLHAGEIVGIAGIDGNGQTELIESLAGLQSVSRGSGTISGEPLAFGKPREVYEQQVAHVPADRQRHGLVMDATLTDNFALRGYYQSPFSRRGLLDRKAIASQTEKGIEDFGVRAAGPHAHASELSGGNQQKLILARELSTSPAVLLASQPTRGLDVGSIETVHRQIIDQRKAGCAIVLVSFELDEIFALSSRILVMFGGRIVHETSRADASRAVVGQAMAGVIHEK
ncbi:MAG: ABC transporter ATP-binding protein [Microbacteriaceae bacterium]